jgi:hypothetical protein
MDPRGNQQCKEVSMVRKRFVQVLSLLIVVGTFIAIAGHVSDASGAEDRAAKFERYRTAIKAEYDIDIKNFKDGIKGGRADGKEITNYPLDQLLMGIKVELEHTTDKMRALEISTDHLEEFPDYYTRLEKMEHEAEEAMKAKK